MSKRSGTFTPYQLKRLPDPGYLVVLLEDEVYDVNCIMNGTTTYCREYKNGSWDWTDGAWTCAPTRKDIATRPAVYQYFPTHADLIQAHPNLVYGCRKAPNDF